MEFSSYILEILIGASYLGIMVGGYFVSNHQKQLNKKVEKDLLDEKLQTLSVEIKNIDKNLSEVKDDVKYIRRHRNFKE